MIGNGLLLLLSIMVLGLIVLYFKRKWPAIDIVDIYLIFIALYYGVYPITRGLYFGKGVVYDSYDSNLLAIFLVFFQVIITVGIVRAVSDYLPARITDYIKIKPLITQWAKVNNLILLAIYVFLIVVHVISYFKYGIRSHIMPSDFDRIGKDLPYWLMSVRKIYSYLTLGISIVLVSKAVLAHGRYRCYWLTLFILYLPLDAYYGRKGFVNIVVASALIWLIINESKLFSFRNVRIAIIVILGFFISSNLHETYRYDLYAVGGIKRHLENPISAAFDFNKTFHNLKQRPGTWEFNYLVFDKQLKAPEKITTNGEIFWEGFKNSIPRIFWPDKKFRTPPEILAGAYKEKEVDVSLGTNIFGISQAEFGYFSIIIVPVAMVLIIIMTGSLMGIVFDYPVFLWLFSVNVLNFFICIEENQNELIFFFRYAILIMSVFLLYVLVIKGAAKLSVKRSS